MLQVTDGTTPMPAAALADLKGILKAAETCQTLTGFERHLVDALTFRVYRNGAKTPITPEQFQVLQDIRDKVFPRPADQGRVE